MRIALLLPAALVTACVAGGGAYIATLGGAPSTTAGRPAPATRTASDGVPQSYSPVAAQTSGRTSEHKVVVASPTPARSATAGAALVAQASSAAPAIVARRVALPAARPTAAGGGQGIVESGFAQRIFNMIVEERVAAHVGGKPIQFSQSLTAVANAHTLLAARYNPDAPQKAHQVPGEPSLAQRDAAAGAPFGPENIGLVRAQQPSEDSYIGTFAAVESIQTLMVNEDPRTGAGHSRNILDPNLTWVGISVVWDQVTNTIWLTEDFGK